MVQGIGTFKGIQGYIRKSCTWLCTCVYILIYTHGGRYRGIEKYDGVRVGRSEFRVLGLALCKDSGG